MPGFKPAFQSCDKMFESSERVIFLHIGPAFLNQRFVSTRTYAFKLKYFSKFLRKYIDFISRCAGGVEKHDELIGSAES